MIRSYFATFLRYFLQHKAYASISILGMAVGIACCLLIMLFIRDEYKYEQFHKNGYRIYRVLREVKMAGSNSRFDTGTSGGITPAMIKDFPEVEAAARIVNWTHWIRYGEKNHEQSLALADAALLRMFGYELVEGEIESALQNVGSILVSEAAARRYFDDENPVGKAVVVDGDKFGGDYVITGVIRDRSRHARFRFDFYTAHPLPQCPPYVKDSAWAGWRPNSGWRPFRNYVMLREGASREALEKKLPAFMARYMGEEITEKNRYHLQRVSRIYLHSNEDFGFRSGGDIGYIHLLEVIAGTILLIACINFMNLATARSASRSLEVGVRKAVGAGRRQLALQFLGESLMLSLAAAVFACGLARLALPVFQELMGANLSFGLWELAENLPALIALTLASGLVAGSYPALFLSGVRPVAVLKGGSTGRSGGGLVRKGLVVFQFAASALLIISTLLVYRQAEHMQGRSLGWNQDYLINTPLFFADLSLRFHRDRVKRAFLRHPDVLKVTAVWPPPGGGGEHHVVRPEGTAENEWEMQILGIEEDFLDTYEIELVAGRNIDLTIASDSTKAFLLNETAVKRLGWDEPLGKTFQWRKRQGYVIGVVKDFHTESLHSPIEPVVMFHWIHPTLSIRIRPENVQETLAFLEETWKEFIPHRPFSYQFQDEMMAGHYRHERRQGRIFGTLSGLAIVVACLGLFGLATYTAEQRRKEIGIRKSLGATVPGLLGLLSRDFLKLAALANVLAWPVAYYAMDRWLEGYPYRIGMELGPFLIAGCLALVIAQVTVSYQALRAASGDPVKALRYE